MLPPDIYKYVHPRWVHELSLRNIQAFIGQTHPGQGTEETGWNISKWLLLKRLRTD